MWKKYKKEVAIAIKEGHYIFKYPTMIFPALLQKEKDIDKYIKDLIKPKYNRIRNKW